MMYPFLLLRAALARTNHRASRCVGADVLGGFGSEGGEPPPEAGGSGGELPPEAGGFEGEGVINMKFSVYIVKTEQFAVKC